MTDVKDELLVIVDSFAGALQLPILDDCLAEMEVTAEDFALWPDLPDDFDGIELEIQSPRIYL